ncbi:1-aminocyclopropane-1-carboxylate synthase-like protein 1 [Astyanax mexicanus]|uniref:1-aminocyclopropane-1-carboxylate synthase-like protein 1 n=1 Tax=Astyanax mexicanus TaxID=7994 RepID=UPI0020CABB9C|nr:1-aminocyclopropane-1-carboxylate synthase-like protein 1 [Astyanax mexicanus]
MDYHGKKYERGSNWSEPEVVELLQVWSDQSVQAELESCLRNQHVFKRIAAALHGRGVYRTGDQCREKIKKLKIEYRRIKENQKRARGSGRAWKFYEVMDRVLTGRPVQPHMLPQQQALHPGLLVSCSSGAEPFTFTRLPNPGELLEIKREELHAEDELLSAEHAPPELIYHIGSEDDEHELESKSIGIEAEELGTGDVVRGEGPAATATSAAAVLGSSSPSGFSDHNMAGSSGAGISPATASMVIGDGAMHGEMENPKSSDSFLQRKRRRAGRGLGSGRLLERALADFLGWQQVMEERYLSLEEMRLQQETRAEERRGQQEEIRAQRDREHELRLLSLFTEAFTAARGIADTANTSVSTLRPDPIPAAPKTVSEPASVSPPPSSPPPEQELHPAPSSAPFKPTMLRGHQTPQNSRYLSRRGNCIRQHQGILQEGYAQYQANKHDEYSNPNGIINMGTSENKLCFDLLQERLTRPDMLYMEPSLLQYFDWKGHSFLREEVAEFLSEHCLSPSPLKAENVVVMNGCGSIFCAMAAVLCDPDDAILIPTPFYGAITEDVDLYSGVKLYCVPLDSKASEDDDRPFQLTAAKLEHALEKAKKEGVNVKAVILVNPHNPLGDVYTAEEMTSFLKFAKKHELHAIVDEVYMLSVFDEDQPFHSVLSLERLPDVQRTHVLWGLSKDFAMAGLRVGTLYSENRDLVHALEQLGCFHGVSGPTQLQVAQLLKDREWMNETFYPENIRRLKEAHQYVASELKKLGIPYLHRGSGFYIWADFSKYLKERTFVEELCMWRCFLKHRVLLSCGQAFSCSSPGWFRIIFSDQRHRLQPGLKRISAALEELRGSKALPRCENSKEDKQKSHRQTQNSAEKEGKTEKESTANNSCTPTKGHCEGTGAEAGSLSLADEDTVVINCQSSSTSESLDSLIGTLRQQIQSSDWLEKNRPELGAEEDPTQLDVFKDLLDRARM